MSLTNIKEKASERGFTIVELLIVIVIIGILAGIVIMAYAGLTNQAKTSKAATVALDINKKFEAYNADPATSGYPVTVSGSTYTIATALTASANAGKAWYIPSGSYTNIGGAITSSNASTSSGDPVFNLYYCGASGGYRIGVWNFSTSQIAYTYLNGASSASTSCGSTTTAPTVITGSL